MSKSRVLEVAVLVLVLAGAFTYQFMHKQASRNKDLKNLVSEELPVLDEQTLDTKEDESLEPEVVIPEPPSRQEMVKGFVSSLQAKSLRKYNPNVSVLGEAPDWAMLDRYQGVITRKDFERLLTTVYTVGDDWKQWIELKEDHALIVQSAGEVEVERYKLEFAKEGNQVPVRYWKTPRELGVTPAGKPLSGMVIAIDPGHIGGDWAVIEERDFAMGLDSPVREGKLTLFVAQMLKPRLEGLGAEVALVRDSLDPINPKRPGHYDYEARMELEGRGQIPSAPALEDLRNKMFYRIDEIRKRALIVNNVIKPDLTLCLHFNASSWGEPGSRKLVDESHFHILLHGAVTRGELAKDDERFSMVKKILMGNHDEEVQVCEAVAKSFVEESGLPAYKYNPVSLNARNIKANDYLWARNLLANRLFESPVVYMEPYIMNGVVDYARIQLGDYEGEKMVGGKMRKSIFQEYCDGMINGLVKYYSETRGVEESTKPKKPSNESVVISEDKAPNE